MDEKSAQKRKSNSKDDVGSVTDPKNTKLSVEAVEDPTTGAEIPMELGVEDDDEATTVSAPKGTNLAEEAVDPTAGTGLLTEIWLDIFDYIKPEDRCMAELSGVCKLFHNICSPRLRILRLDFDKVFKTKRYPVIKNAYTEIRMTGQDIDSRRKKIGAVLASSRESARKLVISVKNAHSSKRCKIRIRTLMFILNCLPNLEEVELVKVNGIPPEIAFEAIQPHERPELASLKKLTMSDVTAATCSAFEKARHIEELTANLSFKKNAERKVYRDMVCNQAKLRVLHNLHATISSLETFLNRLLSSKMKLEQFETNPERFWRPVPLATLIAGPPMKDMKKIVINGRVVGIDIVQILRKFPSLRSFQATGIRWSVPA